MTSTFFDDSNYYTGPDLTDGMIARAERRLGYALPDSYVELLRVRNGGEPRNKCFRTSFPTSWARDHIQIDAIRGLDGTWGIDADGELSSTALIDEWGYPDTGIVICELPSAGHDAVMLDYSLSGAEPVVVYIDEDRVPRVIAESFSEFIANLVPCEGLG